MNTYEWLHERKAKMKRVLIISTIVQYLVFIVIIGYQVFLYNTALIPEIIASACILGLIGFCLYRTSKAGMYANGNKLVINDSDITLQAYKRPDHTISFENIRELKDEHRGLRIIDRRDGNRNLFISNSFENFEEIKNKLAAAGITFLSY